MKSEKNLFQKLLEVKRVIPYMQKDKKSYNYTYASGSSLLGRLNEVLNKEGVILKSEVIETSHELITYITKEGTEKAEMLYKIKTRMTWINCDNPEDRDVNEFSASGMNGYEKGFGSALTYNERYFILKYFSIATDDLDPDAYENTITDKSNIKKQETKPKVDVEMKDKCSRYDSYLDQNKKLIGSDEVMKWARSEAWDKKQLIEKGNELKALVEDRTHQLFLENEQ